MKYRAGFVSNSSSSSFIIVSENEPTISIQDLTVSIATLMDSEPRVIKTLEELQTYICEDHDWIPKEERIPEKMDAHCQNTYWYDEAKDAIEEGQQLYRYWVEQSDQTAMNIMNHFEIVYGD